MNVEIDPADCVYIGRQIEDWDDNLCGLITDVFGAFVEVDPERRIFAEREVAGAKLVPFWEFVETVLYNKDESYRRMLEMAERMQCW